MWLSIFRIAEREHSRTPLDKYSSWVEERLWYNRFRPGHLILFWYGMCTYKNKHGHLFQCKYTDQQTRKEPSMEDHLNPWYRSYTFIMIDYTFPYWRDTFHFWTQFNEIILKQSGGRKLFNGSIVRADETVLRYIFRPYFVPQYAFTRHIRIPWLLECRLQSDEKAIQFHCIRSPKHMYLTHRIIKPPKWCFGLCANSW